MIQVKGTDNSEVIDESDGVTYGADTIIGYGGNDLIYGLNGDDLIYGGEGNDGLIGGEGADILIGGTGMDIAYYMDSFQGVYVSLATGYGYFGTAHGDQLDGIENLAGSDYGDQLFGDGGTNSLYGQGGNDRLSGGGGSDDLFGGIGNDTLQGGSGADSLSGSSGIDTADYRASPARASVSLVTNLNHGGDAEGDTLSGIENVIGSHYDDVLYGDNGSNRLDGFHDDDRLFGFDGSDTLNGDEGDDYLNGGAGVDALIGGVGNDVYYVDSAADAVTESGGEGADEAYTSVSWTMTAGADVETLRTTYDAGVNPINLTGNFSGNIVRGNNGDNVINGGDGNDDLTGLGGQDSFLFDTPLNAISNVDVITDFSVADDTIRLDQTIFSSALGLGNIEDGEFVIGAAAQDVNDRIIYNGTTGALFYDADGVGGNAQVRFATLSAGLALTYLDFLVVA
jgi:Ca2+-binding RTX toxin-like protein